MRFYLSLLAFLCCFIFSRAQNNAFPKDFDKVIPASPLAMQFKKYGDYPVNLANGVVQIAVPLYQVKAQNIIHPIDFSYHSGGIRVDDRDGIVGWGWTLNAGGMVSRVINGNPDEYFNTLHPIKGERDLMPSTQADFYYVEQCAKHQDGEPDEYSYNVSGGPSGSFYIMNINGVRKTVGYDQSNNVKIKCVPEAWSQQLTGFEITDAQGNTYYFNGAREYVLYNGGSGGSIPPHISGWALSEIKSGRYNTSVFFEYYSDGDNSANQEMIITPAHSSSFISWVDDPSFAGGPAPSTTNNTSFPEDFNFYQYRSVRIKRIMYASGEVSFEYVANTTNPFGLRNLLKDIRVKDQFGEVFKHMRLNQSTASGSTRTKLDSVQFKDNTGHVIERYAFDYYGSPAKVLNGDFNRDHWGYLNRLDSDYGIIDNNSTGMRTTIPNWSFPYFTSSGLQFNATGGGANREVNENAVINSGSLKEISYPTGGKTTFEYESNKYYDNVNSVTKLAGGLRIKKIVSYDGIGDTKIKTFKYGTNESGHGVAPGSVAIMTDPANRLSVKFMAIEGSIMKNYFSVSASIFPQHANSSLIRYDVVTEYEGTTTTNIGKTIYRYTAQDNSYYGSFEMWNNAVTKTVRKTFQDWDKGLLLSKEVFKATGGGQYDTVLKETYEYEQFHKDTIVGLKAYWTVGEIVNGQSVEPTMMHDFFYDRTHGSWAIQFPFRYYSYDIFCGAMKVKKSKITNYGPSSTLVTEKNYVYDNIDHLQPTKISTVQSDGETVRDEMKYAQDISPATAISQELIDRNIVQTPLETKQYKHPSTLLKGNVVAFNLFGANILAPEWHQQQVLGNTPFVTSRAHAYDILGNVLELSKENDVRISYVYDYEYAIPVAEVINASWIDIGYTSFEAGGGGNWQGITQSKRRGDQGSLTGDFAYSATSFSLVKPSLTSGTSYIVSYWSRSGSYTVGGTQGGWPKNIKTITKGAHSWTLWEHKITGVTQATVSGTGVIDELRVYPEQAQMISLCQEPGWGITYQCDVNNRITSFHYDRAGRLALIKDEYGNILKKYCYKYNGEVENCNVYMNAEISQAFTRGNCAPGAAGEQVTVTIPAGKYISFISQNDADALAAAALAQKGQQYADRYGGCPTIHYSILKSGVYNKNNCAGGGTGGAVTYTVPAGAYSSIVSQTDANNQAQSDVNANGQAYANEFGQCSWTNDQLSGHYAKNNCPPGTRPQVVEYTVSAGVYSSALSKADANQKATNDIYQNGQAYANTNGTCTYFNTEQSQVFTRNNCGSGYAGNNVTYTIVAGIFEGATQQLANQAALDYIAANGQAYANANGTCTSTTVPLEAENTTGDNISVIVINAANGNMYFRSIPANTSYIKLADLPPGNYNVAFSGASTPRTFRAFNQIQANVTSHTFYNVPFTCSTCASLSVN